MKKKILIGSIIAVAVIVLASFTSVVGKVSSDEDCGCDEDNIPIEWTFPCICLLLLPFAYIGLSLAILLGYPFGEFIYTIGYYLNCFWKIGPTI